MTKISKRSKISLLLRKKKFRTFRLSEATESTEQQPADKKIKDVGTGRRRRSFFEIVSAIKKYKPKKPPKRTGSTGPRIKENK